jgi:hypothetical protein
MGTQILYLDYENVMKSPEEVTGGNMRVEYYNSQVPIN